CRQIGQLTEDKIQTKLIGPSGASAAGSCNGTDKVKGIDPATGQILCGEDVAQAGSGGGTLTDVTGTSPIAVTGSGGVRNIAITENAFAAYSHSHTGYLSSAPDAVTTTNIANGTLLAEDFASIGNCSSICTDANTIYTAGTGLSLTGTTFSVSSITSTMITDGEITAADLGALDYMQLKNSGIYPKASTTTAANWNYIESGGPDCTGTNAGAVRRIRLGTSLSWRDCLCFCGGYSPVQAGINPYKWHCLCT
ncbi:MAG: hypothetical protein MUC50_22540, partial [Myxococcota bacterium]|nr:hypothetical protein [Myxococcota bacterium]